MSSLSRWARSRACPPRQAGEDRHRPGSARNQTLNHAGAPHAIKEEEVVEGRVPLRQGLEGEEEEAEMHSWAEREPSTPTKPRLRMQEVEAERAGPVQPRQGTCLFPWMPRSPQECSRGGRSEQTQDTASLPRLLKSPPQATRVQRGVPHLDHLLPQNSSNHGTDRSHF